MIHPTKLPHDSLRRPSSKGRKSNQAIATQIVIATALLVGLVVFCPTQVDGQDPAEQKPVDEARVNELIERLGSRSFKVRNESEEAIWNLGPTIEPILIKALDTPDLEVRQRIASVRFKFQLGLTPDMPSNLRRWITTAINGSGDKARREATANLARAAEYAAVLVVIKRLQTPQARGDYFPIVMSATRKNKHSDALDDFHFSLLRLAIAEQNVQDSMRLTRHVLRDTEVRKRVGTRSWLERLIKLIPECPSDASRRSLIDGLYFDSNAIREIASSDVLPKWINTVATEKDPTVRYRHVSKLLSTSTLLQAFSSSYSGRIKIDVEKMFAGLSPEGKNAVLDAATRVPAALTEIHRKLGDEAMIKAAGNTDKESVRGNLLGYLASLASWPADKTKKHDILSLIDSEAEGPAKHQLITGYLKGLAAQSSAAPEVNDKVAESIWLMLHTEQHQAWQLAALLETYGSPKVFGKRHSDKTIQRMIKILPSAENADALLYAYAPVSKTHLTAELKKHHLGVAYLRSIGTIQQSISVSSRYRTLLSNTNFTGTFRDKAQRDEVVDFCAKKLDGQTKYYATSGLLRNKTLLGQLLEEGQMEKIRGELIATIDPARRPTVMGEFLANESTIKHLQSKNRLGDILAFRKDKNLSDNERYTILYRLVSSDPAVSALMSDKKYEQLIAAIGEIEDKSRRSQLNVQLGQRKAYTQQLIKSGALSKRLAQLFGDKNWVMRRGYVSLANNISYEEIKKDENLVPEFWKFAIGLEREYDRRECIRALLSSEWFLRRAHEQKKIDSVTDDLKKVLSASLLRSTVSTALSGKGAVYLIKQKQLGVLLAIAACLDETNQRSAYRSMVQSSSMRTWIQGSNQPDEILGALSEVKDAKTRGILASEFIYSGMLRYRDQKDEKEYIGKLIKFVKSQDEMSQAELGLAMLSQFGSNEQIKAAKLTEQVVRLTQQEDLPFALMLRILQSTNVGQAIVAAKKDRDLIDRVLAMGDPVQRSQCTVALMKNYYLQRSLTNSEVKNAFEEFLKTKPSSSRYYTLIASQTLLSKLIELGYFKKLKDIVDGGSTTSSTARSMKWAFYTNAAVVKQFVDKKQKAEPLATLMQNTRSNYVASRLSSIVNSQPAMQWLIDGYGTEPIVGMVDQCKGTDRIRAIQYLVTNSNSARLLQEHGLVTKLLQSLDMTNTSARSQMYYIFSSSVVRDVAVDSKVYFEQLKKYYELEKDGPRRPSLVSLLGHPKIREGAKKHGYSEWLIQVIGSDNEHTSPERLKSMLRSSSSTIAIAIQEDQYDVAEQLLMKIADDDEGLLRLVRFRVARQRYDKTYKPAAFVAPNTDVELKNRFEFYRARALGQPATTDDPGLRWSHLVETHQWNQLAKMEVCKSNQLPLPITTKNINPIHRYIEQRSLPLAFARWSGTAPDAALVGQIRDHVIENRNDKPSVFYGTDAMLAAGFPTEALRMLSETLPRRSFYFHWSRLDYDKAAKVANWQSGNSDETYDSVYRLQRTPEIAKTKSRVYLLEIASMLRDAGRIEEANEAIDCLARQPSRRKYDEKATIEAWKTLAARLFFMGFREKHREVAAKFMDFATARSSHLYAIYSGNYRANLGAEANELWDRIARVFPQEPVQQRLKRLDDAMTGKLALAELKPLLEEFGVVAGVDPFGAPPNQSSNVKHTPLIAVRHRYGLHKEVKAIIGAKQKLAHSDYVLMGRTHLAEKEYVEAAKWFEKAWKERQTDLTRLYLAGHCYNLAGDKANAAQLKQKALCLSFTPQTHFGLALGLAREGIPDQAKSVYRDLLASGVPCHYTVIDSTLRLIELTDAPAERLELWRKYITYNLRPVQTYRDLKEGIRGLSAIETLHIDLALEKGDIETVQSDWQGAAKLNLGNPWFGESFIGDLQKANQPELAKKVYLDHFNYLKTRLKTAPSSPVIKERLDLLREKYTDLATEESR